MDYGYLTNGLLSSINGTAPLSGSSQPVSQMLSNVNTPSFGPTTEDLFRQVLEYNSLTGGLNGSVQQSGNVGQLLWQTRGRTTQAYGLSYDYLDRLRSAQSSEYSASNSVVNSNYFNESQNFDERGNLTSQLRSGLVKGSSAYTVKPDLDAPSLAQLTGTNQTTTATGNGSIPVVNLPLSVPHNFLNLPTSFSFNAGNSIELLYDGLGTKLRRTVKTAGSVTLTQDYLDGIELRNGVVEAVYHPEGRAYNTGSGYRYEYVLRDHLGNTRLVFCDKNGSGSIDNSEILSETHYYPFGRRMDGAWYQDASAGKYRYLYNGKELSDEFDLNFYDYGARWYDPNMGSWWEIDPLAEFRYTYSPYQYAANNPLNRIDLGGLIDVDGDGIDDGRTLAVEGTVTAKRLNSSAGWQGFMQDLGANGYRTFVGALYQDKLAPYQTNFSAAVYGRDIDGSVAVPDEIEDRLSTEAEDEAMEALAALWSSQVSGEDPSSFLYDYNLIGQANFYSTFTQTGITSDQAKNIVMTVGIRVGTAHILNGLRLNPAGLKIGITKQGVTIARGGVGGSRPRLDIDREHGLHYHRTRVDSRTGQTARGQGIGRHRPWEIKKTDKSFWDRF